MHYIREGSLTDMSISLDIMGLLKQTKKSLSESRLRKDKKLFIGIGYEEKEFYVGYYHSFNETINCYQITSMFDGSMDKISNNAVRLHTIADSYEEALDWIDNKLNLVNRTSDSPVFQSFYNRFISYENLKRTDNFSFIKREELALYYREFEDIFILNDEHINYLMSSLLNLIAEKDLDRRSGRNYALADTIEFANRYQKWLDEKFLKFYTISLRERYTSVRIGVAIVIAILKSESGFDEIAKKVEYEPDADVRKYFLFALGESKCKKYYPILKERLLNDPSDKVRRTSVIALGKIGDNRAIKILREKLLTDKLYVKFACVRAIGRFKNRSVFELLIHLLTSTPPAKEKRLKAGICCGLILQENKEAVAHIATILKCIKASRDAGTGPDLIGNLIYAIGKLGDISYLDFLNNLKKDINDIVETRKRALIYDDDNNKFAFMPVRKLLDNAVANLRSGSEK